MSLWNNIYLYFCYKKPPTSDVIRDTVLLTGVVGNISRSIWQVSINSTNHVWPISRWLFALIETCQMPWVVVFLNATVPNPKFP